VADQVLCQDRAHANPESDYAGSILDRSLSAADSLAAVSTVDRTCAGRSELLGRALGRVWLRRPFDHGVSVPDYRTLSACRRTLWHGHRVRVSPADLVGGLRTDHRAPGHPVRKQPEAGEIAQRF